MTAQVADSGDFADRFRAVMAQVPAPVAVVTSYVHGRPHGTTISAFMSLSISPPMLLVSLDSSSTLLSSLEPGSVVGVNILTAYQADLAARFARKDKDDLVVEWEIADGEPPRLPDTRAWLTFTVTELITVADHTLVIGTVTTAHSTANAPPLLHYQRRYGTHTLA